MKNQSINSKIEWVFWASLGLVSLVYILNPTAGIIELLPDGLPLIGNLDEVGATLLLMKSLKELF